LSACPLELRSVTKRFGAVAAVREASVRFEPGRVHALVGENGAGKSTLLGLAGGEHAPDDGSVHVDGSPLVPATPAEAARRGVGFVHQHFMLVEAFSALENIVLGAEPMRSLGRLDLGEARRRAREVLAGAGLELDLEAPVDRLGVGERQRLEIARVLYRGARTLLLDEPTAVLTPGQARALLGTLRELVRAGSAVVLVTHRIAEVIEHCDQVTVMRRGSVVARRRVADTSEAELARDVMGREPPPPIARPRAPREPSVVLSVESLSVAGQRAGRLAVDGVSFEVGEGRIVGVAGVEGNGQRELVRAIAGLLGSSAGRVRLDGRDLGGLDTGARRALGLAVVHEDRHRDGLLLEAPVGDNLVLGDLGALPEEPAVRRRIERFGVMPPEPARRARDLSGGNQQKVVTARALDRKVRAAVLAQPTRGVDLGAARAIHEAILETARGGAAVLVVSADLAELRALCHELIVIARGRIVARLSPDAPDDQFGRAMLGAEAAAPLEVA
jgi:simple sugar transport system ATP-binding protein